MCPRCKTRINDLLRICPTCGADWGFPNVRAAEKERVELLKRHTKASAAAAQRGCDREFHSLLGAVKSSAHVVLAVPPLFARNLLGDRASVYQNYERLVSAGARVPAELPNDTKRCAVGALLFGSYAHEIRYGALSLNGSGLWTYGKAILKLKDVAIDSRVSFLETNSFNFIENHKPGPGQRLPMGYRSTWADKQYLAGAKLQPYIKAGQTATDWAPMLIQTGKSRAADEFIEAHIFGPFTAEAVQEIGSAPDKELTRDERIDIKAARAVFKKLKKSTP